MVVVVVVVVVVEVAEVVVVVVIFAINVWYNEVYVRHWGNNKFPNTVIQLKLKFNTLKSTK